MSIQTYQLRQVVKQLGKYYEKAEDTTTIIINCALVATGGAVADGNFPALAVPIAIVSCLPATWTMYVKLCQKLDISISENTLKLLARAVISNIASNLVGELIALVAAMFLPGGSVAASAVVKFVTLYLAGVIFLNLILRLAQKSGDPHNFGGISANEMKKEAANIKMTKADLQAAKADYEANKDNPKS